MTNKKKGGPGGGGSQPGDAIGRRRRRGVELPDGGSPRLSTKPRTRRGVTRTRRGSDGL